MKKVKHYQIIDPNFGPIQVMEHEHGMMMTNAKPNKSRRWVSDGEVFRWKPTPNRAARRSKK